MKILFLSRWFPYPVNNGSKLRIHNLLRGLAKLHEVTLLSFADQPDVSPDAPELQSVCSEVHVLPWREFDPNSRNARLGLLGSKPRFLTDTHSVEMADMLRSLISKNNFDLVIASQLSMASYYPYFGNVPALFEEIELGVFHDGAAYADGFFRRLRLSLTWFKLRKYFSRLLDSFRACTVVSERERRLFAAHFPEHNGKVSVIPNCINVEEYEKLSVEPIPDQLIFSGPFRYYANYEAMQWFVGEVFPKVLEQVPDARLLITGDHAGLPLPPAPNVKLTGYVADIKSLIASSWVSVAPLLSGGGTRLKILEAMAVGTPVISTTKGAEGLDARADEHVLIADSPQAFADQVIRTLKDGSLRKRLSVHGQRFVKEKYNWETMMPRFLQLVEGAAE
jgi:glycosyltransferase involved in cell wall biosynthesis